MSDPAQLGGVSVVIPVKNGCSTLTACLEGIFSQTMRERLQVIVIDSGSTDGTLNLLANYPVQVHQIPPTDFNHGETRNLGMKLARGEFVAMTVQDARPVDDRWLERMLKHFEDPKVAGVCGQQVVPHELDKNPLQWFRPQSQPVARKISFAEPAEFTRLSPAEQVQVCGWDDVNALYRRSALMDVPFRRVDFAEDFIWARDALSRGYALVYDYSARVYHYHHESFAFRFRRQFTALYHAHRYFGLVSTPREWIALEFARLIYRASRPKYCPQRRLKWAAYNVSLALAEWMSRWCYWLTATLGGNRVIERWYSCFCATQPQPVHAR